MTRTDRRGTIIGTIEGHDRWGRITMNNKSRIELLEVGSGLVLIGATVLWFVGLVLLWPDPIIGTASGITIGIDQQTMRGALNGADAVLGADPVDTGEHVSSSSVQLFGGESYSVIGFDRVVGAVCVCLGVVLAGIGTIGLEVVEDEWRSVEWIE